MLVLRFLIVLATCYAAAALATYIVTGNRNMLRNFSQGLLILLITLALLGIATLLIRFVGPLL